MPHLGDSYQKTFVKYFEESFQSYSSMMGEIKLGSTSKTELEKITTNSIYLIPNEVDDDYISIGIADSEGYFNPDGSLAQFKVIITTRKENVVHHYPWIYDFYINDDFAYCYFCDNNFLGNQVCKVKFEFKTWGPSGNILLKTDIYTPSIEEDNYEVGTFYLKGSTYSMNTFWEIVVKIILESIFLLIPSGTIYFNTNYTIQTHKDNRSLVTKIGNLFCTTLILFYFLVINIHALII